MMKFDDIVTLIEKCKTPYLRICDLHSNKILSIENTTINATIKEFQDYEEMLKAYGKLEIAAATPEMFKSNYKGCYKWMLVFVNKSKDAMAGMPNNYMQPTNAIPVGYISNEVMMAKLETLQKQMEWNKEKAELERKAEKDKDGLAQYMPLAPFLMSAMGKTDEQIGAMMKWAAMSNSIGFKSGKPPTNTLTFKDVEKMSDEAKNKKIEELMAELADKISAEHMILLLEALNKKPELAEKAINFLPHL